MVIKFILFLVAVLAGCNAYPTLDTEQDMSMYFRYVDSNSRILGGAVAPNGAHPWMAALTNGANRWYLCGGSIITRRTILTAAHCITAIIVNNSLSGTARLTVGTNRWNSGGRIFALFRAVIYWRYNRNYVKYDVGLLHTNAYIVMTNLVRPIPLSFEWIGAGMNSRVAGWGVTRLGGPASAALMQLNVHTVDGNRCSRDVATVAAQNRLGAPPVWPHVEICTFHSRNHGTCHGDSGSPLVRVDRGQQIGIVSWGVPCALGAPDVYVRVSAVRDFIQRYTLH